MWRLLQSGAGVCMLRNAPEPQFRRTAHCRSLFAEMIAANSVHNEWRFSFNRQMGKNLLFLLFGFDVVHVPECSLS